MCLISRFKMFCQFSSVNIEFPSEYIYGFRSSNLINTRQNQIMNTMFVLVKLESSYSSRL